MAAGLAPVARAPCALPLLQVQLLVLLSWSCMSEALLRVSRTSPSTFIRENSSEQVFHIYVASGEEQHPIIRKRFARSQTYAETTNFSKKTLDGHKFLDGKVSKAMNSSKTKAVNQSGVLPVWQPCTAHNTIFDLGFFDGADAVKYLQDGYCVLGVEADPQLVEIAMSAHATWISAGRLTMANVAIAPSESQPWTSFYRNKCTREWNSFYKTIGCRTCEPPIQISPHACEEVQLVTVTCKSIVDYFGVPYYFKMDIEGAEPGCFEALRMLGPSYLPRVMSAEITELSYLDTMHSLGYTRFKLVRQDWLRQGEATTSGPWGDSAYDCRVGIAWRTYMEARWEMHAILNKGYDASDPCSGGICPVHDQGCASANIWYDVHATIDPVV